MASGASGQKAGLADFTPHAGLGQGEDVRAVLEIVLYLIRSRDVNHGDASTEKRLKPGPEA